MQKASVFDKLSQAPFVYYVHSYYAQNYRPEDILGYSSYGSLKIPGLVRKDNILGAQFHPEKSGEDGLNILRWFKEEFAWSFYQQLILSLIHILADYLWTTAKEIYTI